MNIFFDLDGTLVDSRKRLYYLFQHLVKESALSFDDYWVYKRNGVSHRTLLINHFQYSDENVNEFEKKWMERIELPEWISLDKPFEGITPFLIELKNKHKIFLVTARQFESVALKQIKEFGWENIFEGIFVTSQKKEKHELIVNVVDLKTDDWFVGDTGKDIQTGKKLGIKTAAVSSGFLSEESLIKYSPDIIAASVMQLKFN